MSFAQKKEIHLTISDEENLNQRIDQFLSQSSHFESRSQVEKLIQDKKIWVNDKPAKSSYRVQTDDHIIIYDWPKEKSIGLEPLEMNLDILFEDDDVLVVNKPANLVVHPATSHENDTLVNALIARSIPLATTSDPLRPGIVHRLDMHTSGLLVVAKTDIAYESLVQQFKERTTQRIYWAIVFGEPSQEQFTISSFLARHPKHRKKYASTENEESGKKAISHFNKIETKSGLSLLKVQLETGRTHQIRVHISENGFPIVGDELYGGKNRSKNLKSVKLRNSIKKLKRFALHASMLGFTHPSTQKELTFHAPWPEDLQDIVNHCLFQDLDVK